MSEEKIYASNGDIWRATKIVLAIRSKEERRFVIEKGELVEFRYWYPATVRTRDGLYLTIEEVIFYESFEYVGRIFEEVYWRNTNTTAEIIDARLYECSGGKKGEMKDEYSNTSRASS